MPTLAELLRDPAQAASLSPPERSRLLGEALALVAMLASAPVIANGTNLAAASDEVEWLSPAGVEAKFGLSARWLEDHAAELRRLKIVSAPSRKVRVYSRAKLARYVEARAG